MNIAVAYNDDVHLKTHLNDVERIGEEAVAGTAAEIAAITGGTLLPVREVGTAIAELRRMRPDVVVNLCEGVQGNPRWEMHFALVLEMLGIPFTGCDPIAVGLCGDKWMSKRLLRDARIGTPDGFLVTRAGDVPELSGLWIVKPAREDAGIGIDAASVCRSQRELQQRCAAVIDTYHQPAIVEEFIDGREFNQALFHGREGLVILPPGEIVFADELAVTERVVGWKAKWAAGSAEDRATVNKTPGVMDDTLRRDLASVCTAAVSLLSTRGYCRIDIRQRQNGELCIIDINPNPDIGQGTGFRKALQAAGIEFSHFLEELMISALPAGQR